MTRLLVRVLQIVLPLAVLAGAGFAAIIIIQNRPPVEIQPPRFEPPGVRVHEVRLEDVQLSVSSQGTVRPRTQSQLVPEISGRVVWVRPSFAEGGFFEAGDVLVKIDPFDYQQVAVSAQSTLAQARLRLAQEEAEAEVARREWEALGVGDPRELTLREPQLAEARAAVAAAKANLVRAGRDLERADITAPYAGRVRRKSVDVGQFVTIGTSIATIYAVDVAEIRLPLPDEVLAYLNLPLSYRDGGEQLGPRVVLRATFAGRTHQWEGRIVRTESEIDPATRMVHAISEVQDPYTAGPDQNRPPLAVGMYVEADIEGRTFSDVAVLPRTALRGRSQVLIVDAQDQLHFRDIKILRATTTSIIIERGIAEGELVIVSAIDSPIDGMTVQITNDDPSLLARHRHVPPVAPEPVAKVITAAPRPRASPAVLPDWLKGLIAEESEAAPAPVVRTAVRRDPSPTAQTVPAAPRLRQPDAKEEVATPAAVQPAAPAATSVPADAPTIVENAVTVLPFRNLSQQPLDGKFGRALTRAVSEQLASIDTLTVTPSSNEAHWIIGGGIQRVGKMIRVTARLVDSNEDAVLRAIKVDGTVDNLASLQDEVVTTLSDTMQEVVGVAVADRVSPAAETTTIAVLSFDDLNQRSADSELGTAFQEAITNRLAAMTSLTILLADGDASWVVRGGIQQLGHVVRVTAQVVDANSSSVLKAVKIDGNINALPELMNRVATAVSDSVREELGA